MSLGQSNPLKTKVVKVSGTDDGTIGPQMEIGAPEVVQIVIDRGGQVIWVNVDGICRLRASRVGTVRIEDQRQQ